MVFGLSLLGRLFYLGRLCLYLGGAALWGVICLRFVDMLALPVLLLGIFGCLTLEMFNRYRVYMYNTLLQQYKKRKQLCSTKSE